MTTASKNKKLLKSIEADLEREIELQKAQQIIKCFSRCGGRGVPTILVKDAVKTLYKQARKQTINKEKRVTKSISKYADKIDENMAALNDLLGDVVYDTSNILETLAINDPKRQSDDEEEDEDEEQADGFIQALLEPAVSQKKKQAEKQMLGAMPVVPIGPPSDNNDDDDQPGGGGEDEQQQQAAA